MTVSATHRRLWHPLTGALVVSLGALICGLALLFGKGEAALSLSAFLAMGAIAGFSVSGST